MRNNSLLKVYLPFDKIIGPTLLFFFILLCFFPLICPCSVDALQSKPMGSDDLQYNDSDDLLFDPLDSESQKFKIELMYHLNNGSYNTVLEKIEFLPIPEKNKSAIIGLKAAALIGKDDFAAAMDEYNILKERNDVLSQSFSLVAHMLLIKKKPFAAMAVCQSGLMRDIKSSKLLYQMGYAYSTMGKSRTAVAYFNGAAAANTESRELKQSNIEKAIALAYYKLNDFEKAKNALNNIDPSNTESGINLIINAKYHGSMGNYDTAISFLDKAHKSSRYLEAELIKAQLLILNNKPKEAISLLNDLDHVLSQSNFSDMLKLIKALAFLTDKKPGTSLELLKKVEHPEKIPNIHMLKAITYFSMDKKKETIEELKQTSMPYSELAALPDFEKSLNQPSIGPDIGLAFFCIDQKFYKEAVKVAERAALKSKNDILLNFIMAESYLQSEQFSSAIKELIKINKTFQGSYALQFYLSQAYAKAGMLDDAVKTYKSLTEERPDFIMADLVYGKLLSDFSKWEEARKVYENGLNFMPDSPRLQLSLGWTLAHLNELDSLENLLQIIEKNKKIQPASFRHLKGWWAFKTKEFSKAEEWLRQAIETAPGDPEICFHLGMAMLKTGKHDMAANLLQQSLLFKKQRDRYQDRVDKVLLKNK